MSQQDIVAELQGIEHAIADLQLYHAASGGTFGEGLAEGLVEVEKRVARVRAAIEERSR